MTNAVSSTPKWIWLEMWNLVEIIILDKNWKAADVAKLRVQITTVTISKSSLFILVSQNFFLVQKKWDTKSKGWEELGEVEDVIKVYIFLNFDILLKLCVDRNIGSEGHLPKLSTGFGQVHSTATEHMETTWGPLARPVNIFSSFKESAYVQVYSNCPGAGRLQAPAACKLQLVTRNRCSGICWKG